MATETNLTRAGSTYAPGQRIEVRRRFDRAWARGFEVVDVTTSGVIIRRCSDRAVLPATFLMSDIRPAAGSA